MISINIVRIVVSNGEGKHSINTIRYVPLAEYDLWKFLMIHKHNFFIKDEESTIWIDEEEYERKRGFYPSKNLEFVNRVVTYLYSKKDNMLFPVTRFFPKKDYENIKKTFLSHLTESSKKNNIELKLYTNIDKVVEIEGYCVKGYHNLPL
ncbi:MAG: hypothetical protein V1872_09585 [bacterium]